VSLNCAALCMGPWSSITRAECVVWDVLKVVVVKVEAEVQTSTDAVQKRRESLERIFWGFNGAVERVEEVKSPPSDERSGDEGGGRGGDNLVFSWC
jgi:hypothetical protein